MPVHSYTGDRLVGLLDFIEAVRGWGSQGRDLARRIYREVLAQPDLAPSDNCFLLEEEGNISIQVLGGEDLFPEHLELKCVDAAGREIGLKT